MGNCCDGDTKVNDPNSESDERSTLLQNPASSHSRGTTSASKPILVDHSLEGTSASSAARSSEQSALSRILHETATNVVDVSAMSPHSIEQQEYMDRARQYKTRMSSFTGSGSFIAPVSLPDTGLSPYEVLSKPPVSSSDIRFIQDASTHVTASLVQFEVKQTEPLVVPFGVA